MTALARRGSVLGLLVLAGLVGLLASSQPWFRAVGTGAPGDPAAPEGAIAFSGAEASGGLTQALAAVVLAGVLLTLVLGVRGRRVVAVLLGLAGVGMLLVGTLRTPPSPVAVRSRFRQVSLADSYLLDGTGWPWPYAVAGLLVVVGAVLLWVGSPGWIRRTRRYERADAQLDARDEIGAWRALDAGLDPTTDQPADRTPDRGSAPAPGHESTPSSDPDVRSDGTTDTMVPGQESTPQSTSRRQIGDQ